MGIFLHVSLLLGTPKTKILTITHNRGTLMLHVSPHKMRLLNKENLFK